MKKLEFTKSDLLCAILVAALIIAVVLTSCKHQTSPPPAQAQAQAQADKAIIENKSFFFDTLKPAELTGISLTQYPDDSLVFEIWWKGETVAERDNQGKWHITNCDSALESIYRANAARWKAFQKSFKRNQQEREILNSEKTYIGQIDDCGAFKTIGEGNNYMVIHKSNYNLKIFWELNVSDRGDTTIWLNDHNGKTIFKISKP